MYLVAFYCLAEREKSSKAVFVFGDGRRYGIERPKDTALSPRLTMYYLSQLCMY